MKDVVDAMLETSELEKTVLPHGFWNHQSRFVGAVDAIYDPLGFQGWVVDKQKIGYATSISALVGSKIVAKSYAVLPRPEIDEHLNATTNCSFNIRWSYFDRDYLERALNFAPDEPIKFYIDIADAFLNVVCERLSVAEVLGKIKSASTFVETDTSRFEFLYTEFRSSGLFDEAWYKEAYQDQSIDGDALRHYITVGASLGWRPNFYFDQNYYQRQLSQAMQAEQCLLHYIRHGSKSQLRPSIHFDPEWYLAHYRVASNATPLADFLEKRPNRNPNPYFDYAYFKAKNGEIEIAGDAYYKYFTIGVREGRLASEKFDSKDYVENYLARDAATNPFEHFLRSSAGEKALGSAPDGASFQIPSAEEFDETEYLRKNPDIALSVIHGEYASGYAHYVAFGVYEGRKSSSLPYGPINCVLNSSGPSQTAASASFRHSSELMLVSSSGGIMIVGWMDDTISGVDVITLTASSWRFTFDGASLARIRRMDVEAALGGPIGHSHGYIGLTFADQLLGIQGQIVIKAHNRNGSSDEALIAPRLVDDIEFRNIALSYIYNSEYFGDPSIEAIREIDKGIGRNLIDLNLNITKKITATPYLERMKTSGRKLRGSIVVCLYGKLEYFFLQNALFSRLPGIEDYEFIYACNSPELSESLIREAKGASNIYGLDQSIVILSGNAGFGAANNVAAAAARSDRILIINPDVFPKDLDWATKHTALLEQLPADQTRLFGVPLYYDDGSLMHGGMYFDKDYGVSFDRNMIKRWELFRVEHYGKGVPAETQQFLRSRPVSAVTGAFISIERTWFEKLGGFTEDYIFGHYEDADLCLKSLAGGTAPWIHDIRLWHLEGKGSTKLPVHSGGSMVNRWLFSKTRGPMINEDLLGQTPSHPLLNPGKLLAQLANP